MYREKTQDTQVQMMHQERTKDTPLQQDKMTMTIEQSIPLMREEALQAQPN
jgi:hypothetical protein